MRWLGALRFRPPGLRRNRANRFADSRESLDSRESFQGSWTEPPFLRIALRGLKVVNRRCEAIRTRHSLAHYENRGFSANRFARIAGPSKWDTQPKEVWLRLTWAMHCRHCLLAVTSRWNQSPSAITMLALCSARVLKVRKQSDHRRVYRDYTHSSIILEWISVWITLTITLWIVIGRNFKSVYYLCVCQSRLIEFVAELTEFAAKLSEVSSPKQYSRYSVSPIPKLSWLSDILCWYFVLSPYKGVGKGEESRETSFGGRMPVQGRGVPPKVVARMLKSGPEKVHYSEP